MSDVDITRERAGWVHKEEMECECESVPDVRGVDPRRPVSQEDRPVLGFPVTCIRINNRNYTTHARANKPRHAPVGNSVGECEPVTKHVRALSMPR
jgi:hypothetical protein